MGCWGLCLTAKEYTLLCQPRSVIAAASLLVACESLGFKSSDQLVGELTSVIGWDHSHIGPFAINLKLLQKRRLLQKNKKIPEATLGEVGDNKREWRKEEDRLTGENIHQMMKSEEEKEENKLGEVGGSEGQGSREEYRLTREMIYQIFMDSDEEDGSS